MAKKYRAKNPDVVEAVQWTGYNYHEMAKFLGWDIDRDDLFLPLRTP